MKIPPVWAQFYADLNRRTEGGMDGQTQTDGQTYRQAGRHDEANSRFSQFAKAPKIQMFKFT